jgi:hypothetical protein
MAYNFKSIADVEVVAEPTESANVLIEENGVIKKAPKTAVGGAGGNTEWDAIIELIDGASGSFDSMELVSGSYEDIKEKIFSGILPNVLMRYTNGTYITGTSKVSGFCCILDEEEFIHLAFLCYYNMRQVKLYSDGIIEN